MVYDCFTFFNELDLLEIRLNVLAPVVDKFVLVECDRTFSNNVKPLYYEENKERFASFTKQIIHIKITKPPSFNTAWEMENYQRNMIAEGIKNCSPDDTILISDLDEIPNPNAIENYRGGVFKLEQKIHCFFLNYVNISKNCWYGTRIMKYNDILRNVTENYEYAYGEEFPEFLNRGCTPTKIRMITGFPMLKNGGWHFTYLGGIEGIKTKIMAFSHQEYNNEEFLQDDVINKKLKKGIDFFRPKNYRYIPVLITNKILPEYIVENQDKYTALIYRDVRLFRNVLVLISFKGYSFALRVYRSIRHIMKFER